jgi:adenine-specific DNA-methyltransferase
MADELDVLLEKVVDPALRAELRAAVDKVRAKRSFGLVFESHLPERVRLPEYPVRRGTTVVRRADKRGEPMKVAAVRRGQATVVTDDGTRETVPVEDLVVVAEFGEPVYPGLASVGSIQRGGDKPAHVVINAENHHALEMLQFTHAGKVDCIYIDPPYNTGARDWKYDNNYVDGEDAYRHSKWLAFMERRLLLSKELLNPDDSVLIVTIDEKEFLRLGLLLQQTFPSARVQMVSIVINPSGASSGGLSRVDEYAFFCFFGAAQPSPLAMDLLDDRPAGDAKAGKANVRWEWLLRGGGSWYRQARPNLCYPVILDESGERIIDVGPPFEGEDEENRPRQLNGRTLAWPVRSDGRLGIWRVDGARLKELASNGYAYISESSANRGTWTIRYLLAGTIASIEAGEFRLTGRGPRGQVLVECTRPAMAVPKTVWKSTRHVAGGGGGTQMLTSMLGERNRFTYPKSLYAVEDAVNIATADKPDAVVLDFFAGSGTTAHAVMRLNRQDGGRRQAIVVTNNEVSADEANSLTEQGHNDGAPEWEALGIFEHITRPRIAAAVTGLTPDGAPIKGDYKFTDEFPMAEGFEENVEFMKLTYLDPVDVELDRAFAAVAPMLWLRAGGQGSMVAERTEASGDLLPFAVADRYGVLFDPDRWRDFLAALPDSAGTVFVVTDSAVVFAGVAESLPADLAVVRLYEKYLTTFAINQGRAS